jgi:glycosyltransferase involved in cell wall biosynthesis
MSPRISVIIPTFNRAHLVRQAIDSVIAQKVPDVEIIVVDDGSTDNTESVVGDYAGRVQYIRTENGGVAHARNIGTRHASGRFLTFLDSDDRHYPFTLELESRVLERLPEAAFVCSEMSGFDDAGFFERHHLKTYHGSAYRDPRLTYERIFERSMRLDDVIMPPDSLLQGDPDASGRRLFLGHIFDTYLLKLIVCQNTVMFRREVLLQAGARNERIKYWEDVDLLLRICRRHPVCFVDVPTYQLRYHAAQISSLAGPEGKYVWMRKQQILLRVTKRHAFADGEYYRRHREQLDRHLAHLHRAAAIPMMLIDTASHERTGYARRARKYIARCRRLGHPARVLWLMSFLPGPLRRLGVTIMMYARRGMMALRQRHLRAVPA